MSIDRQKRIVITGAAGAVGNAVAQALVAKGHQLALIFRKEKQGEQLEKQFGNYGKNIMFFQAELSEPEQVEQGLSAALKTFGKIDALVNAAGGWIGGKRLHEHSVEEFQKMLGMDLIPSFVLMRTILPIMAAQKSGCIIHFSALSALASGANNSAYAASKSAALKLIEAASEEYREDGVQICAIAPTIIDTPGNRKAMPDADRSSWTGLPEIIETVEFLLEMKASLSGSVFKLGGRK